MNEDKDRQRADDRRTRQQQAIEVTNNREAARIEEERTEGRDVPERPRINPHD